MASSIKGIRIKIGADTQELTTALSGVNKQAKSIQNELKQVDKLLKLDPSNTELLAQKEQLLAEAVTTTKDKLNQLKVAAEQASEQLAKGEISEEQYRALQREIIKTEQELKNAEKAAAEFNATFAKISATAGKVGEAADKVADKTAKLSAAAGAAAAGLLASAYKAGQAADEINTLSMQSGFSTADIQAWQYAADRIDVSADTIIGAARKLKKNMASSGAAESFRQLGVEVTNVDGTLRDSTAVFYEVVAALGQIPNETDRDVLAMQLFGKSADDLAGLVDDGGAALQQFAQEAMDAGLILSQDALDGANRFNDAIDMLKAKAQAAFMSAGASLAENLMPELDALVEKGAALLEWIAQLDGGQLKVLTGVLAIVAAISPLAKLISGITVVVEGLSTAMTFLAANPIVAVIAAIGLLVTALVTLWNTNEDFRNAVAAIWTGIGNAIGGVVDKIGNFFVKTIPDKINAMKEAFARLPEQMGKIGAALLQGLWSGITSKVDWLKTQIQGVIDKIKSWFTGKQGYDVNSPSKWSKKIGEYIDEGFADGIIHGKAMVTEAAAELKDAMGDGLIYGKTLAAGVSEAATYATASPSTLKAMPNESIAAATSSSGSSADAITAAITAGYGEIADAIFAALPKEVIFNIDSKKIAKAIWNALDTEAENRNRIFAPTHEQIMKIAQLVI